MEDEVQPSADAQCLWARVACFMDEVEFECFDDTPEYVQVEPGAAFSTEFDVNAEMPEVTEEGTHTLRCVRKMYCVAGVLALDDMWCGWDVIFLLSQWLLACVPDFVGDDGPALPHHLCGTE